MTKRTAARSYVAAFLVLWAVSAAVWLLAFKAPLAALVAPIAPIFFGCSLLASSTPGVGLFSVAVAGVATAPITLSLIREPRLPIVLIAHVTLVAYWCWSFALLGAGL